MKTNIPFRAWYYFRQGWSIYFAFIMSAINTLTVTYYLAIEKAPFLKAIFPSFMYYVFLLVVTAIPILTAVGYVHTKRSKAYTADSNITMEANPHMKRMLLNTEKILQQHMKISEMLVKISKNEKLEDGDLDEIMKMHTDLKEYSKKRTMDETGKSQIK